jgi:EAL domain-containing protein (putative c-di-GMP-specific phosphodiesterase class I)/GGDEF domain-containing protein
MIPKSLHAYLAPLTAGALVTLLAYAAGAANESLHRTQTRAAVAQRLQMIATRLRAEVDLLFTMTADGPVSSRPSTESITWSFDGESVHAGSDQSSSIAPITLELRRLRANEATRRLLGPYPAADGRQFFITLVPNPRTRGAWDATGIALDELLNHAGVDAMLRGGIDISIDDLTHARPVFRLDTPAMTDPARVSVDFYGTRWEIAGEPHAGWARSALARWTLIMLLGTGAAYWTYWLSQSSGQMSATQAHLLQRIGTLNAALAEALLAKEVAETQRTAFTEVDAATGVANRRAFCETVERQLRRIRGELNHGIAVIVVQFEQARAIAAAFSQASVDEILKEAAARILSLPDSRGSLGRISDIELAMWIEVPPERPGYEPFTQLIIEALSRPFTVAGLAAHVSFAAGVSVTATGNTFAEDAVRQASAAAQDALSRGSGTCLRFEPTTRERAITRLQLETDLRHGLASGGLCLHYQPIVTLDTRQLAGFEALLRWQHPLEGLLLPSRFLAVAESAHLLLDIDRWVMRQAVAQARQWGVELERSFFLSVNVSPQHFARRELVTEISELLREYKVPPERLHLEVTEGALISNLESATSVATELRSLGVHICLDDFGTGYSSLNHLRSLPLDSLKVDRSFIDRMVNNSKDFGVVKTIIDLAHYLELACVVEGVESAEQNELLQVLAPDFGQGFLYSAALAADDAERFLRNSEPQRRAALG